MIIMQGNFVTVCFKKLLNLRKFYKYRGILFLQERLLNKFLMDSFYTLSKLHTPSKILN